MPELPPLSQAVSLLAAGLIALAPTLSLAQGGYGGNRGGESSTVPVAPVPQGMSFNAAATGEIVTALRQGTDFCRALGRREYVLDCLAYQYWEVQRQLPTAGDYAAVRGAIRQAAEDLEALARSNRSGSAAPARLSSAEGRGRTTRAILPVAQERLTATGARGAAIVDQAQAQLLRSSAGSQQARESLQQIAQALDSGALLLRSL